MLNNQITVNFKISGKAKRLRLERDGHVFVLIFPLKHRIREGITFLFQQRHWLKKQHANISQNFKSNFFDRDLMLLWGQVLHVGIKYHPSVFNYEICLNRKLLILQFPLFVPIQNFPQVFYFALKSIGILEMQKYVSEVLIPKYQIKTDLKALRINFKYMKTQWGSLSPKNSMTLNSALVFAPQEILEYVYVHELAHLKHRNHGARFWWLVSNWLPEYAQKEKWLLKNGELILHYAKRLTSV